MKDIIIHLLICPACLPEEENLSVKIDERAGDDILTGLLSCPRCNARYPIIDGIAFLLPVVESKENMNAKRYESQPLLSSYIWSHFSELMNDEDANTAYKEWSETISAHSGLALDAGCAVGRFTYEMSEKFDFAIGIDNSRAFISAARNLMKTREIEVAFKEEGLLIKHKSMKLPDNWKSSRVEFIVGDIQYLPFMKNTFSCSSSLNLVDRVPMPLMHLMEMNRVSREKDAQFLLSDPFSWSTDIAKKENWLGGTSEGLFPGKAMENIRALLTGKGGSIEPAWDIEEFGNIWWKIRNHQNHFELIRSCFIKAVR